MNTFVGTTLCLLFVFLVVLPIVSLIEPFAIPVIKWYFRQLDRLSQVFAKKEATNGRVLP